MIAAATRNPILWAVLCGVAIAAIAMLWLTIALLTGSGATKDALLPALLFLLPVLGLGALAGWLIGLAATGIARLARRPAEETPVSQGDHTPV